MYYKIKNSLSLKVKEREWLSVKLNQLFPPKKSVNILFNKYPGYRFNLKASSQINSSDYCSLSTITVAGAAMA